MSITMRFGSAEAEFTMTLVVVPRAASMEAAVAGVPARDSREPVAGGMGAMGATGAGDATGGVVEPVAPLVAGGTVVVVVEAPAAGGGGVSTEPSDERLG
jgi:hypothetical protein